MSSIGEIYEQINAFRDDPASFDPSCGSSHLGGLTVSPELEEAAMWQATHQCVPVTHKTCPQYCYLYEGRCDHITRIRHFIGNDTWNINELLVQGPRHPFPHLVGSVGHCQHLLANNINSMGGAVVGNLFILCLAFINSRA